MTTNLDYVYDCLGTDEIREWMDRSFKLNNPVGVECYDNATILPSRHMKHAPWMGMGGVVTQTGEFVEKSSLFVKDMNTKGFGGCYEYDEADVITIDEEVLYMGPFTPHWGHCMYDFISRLWYVVEHDPGCKVVICGFDFDEGKIPENYLKLFEYIGIDRGRIVDVRKLTRYSKIIIPQSSLVRDCYFTDQYLEIISRIKENALKGVNLPKYDKILFSRAHFVKKNGKERGEEQVDALFERLGFKILYPEELSTVEQIAYISTCKELAVIPGGAQTNCVFISPGANIYLLQKCNIAQSVRDNELLAELCQVNSTIYLDIFLKITEKMLISYGTGPYLLGINEHVARFAADNGIDAKDIKANVGIKNCLWCACNIANKWYLTSKFWKTIRKTFRKVRQVIIKK